jgi:hypothetical protein
VTVAVTSDFTSAENFGTSVPTTSTASSRVPSAAGTTVTGTGGRPASATGAAAAEGGSVGVVHEASATRAATTRRSRG